MRLEGRHHPRRPTMQTLINTRIPDFKLQAYHNDNFKTVTQDDLRGKAKIE